MGVGWWPLGIDQPMNARECGGVSSLELLGLPALHISCRFCSDSQIWKMKMKMKIKIVKLK